MVEFFIFVKIKKVNNKICLKIIDILIIFCLDIDFFYFLVFLIVGKVKLLLIFIECRIFLIF